MSHKLNTPIEALSSAIINGVGNTIATSALTVRNSTPEDLFVVRDDGTIEFKNFSFPTTDGTASQSLVTDGLGNLTWGAPSSAEWARDFINGIIYPRNSGDDVNIGLGNIVVKNSNNFVGINSSSPSNPFEVGYATTPVDVTSPTSGIKTASSQFGAEGPASAFDNNFTSGATWISGGPAPQWLAYEFTDGPRAIARYSLTGGASRPTDWTFEAWDGASWIILDTRTAQNISTIQYYSFANTTLYNKYRWNFTAGISPTEIRVYEAELFEASSFTTAITLSSLGLVSIGNIIPTARLHIKSTGNTSATFAQKIENSTSTTLLSVRDDGLIEAYKEIKVGGTANNGIVTAHRAGFPGQYIGLFGDIWPTLQDSNGGRLSLSPYYDAVSVYTSGLQFPRGTGNVTISTAQYYIDSPARSILLTGGPASSASTGANQNGGNIEINGGNPFGTGTKGLVKIQGLTYPSADGTASQAIISDGLGNLSFGAPSSAEWARDIPGAYLYPRTAGDSVLIPVGSKLYFRATNSPWIQSDALGDSLQFGIVGNTLMNLFTGVGASQGNLSVGRSSTSATARIHARGADSTSANYALKLEDSALANLLSVRNDGRIDFKSMYGAPINANTEGWNWYVNNQYGYGIVVAGGANGNIRFTADTSEWIVTSKILNLSQNALVQEGIIFGNRSTNPTNRIDIKTDDYRIGFYQPTDIHIQASNMDNFSDFNTAGTLFLKGGDGFAGQNHTGGNVEIRGGIPTGTGIIGSVKIQGLTYPSTDGTASQAIITDGLGNLSFGAPSSAEWARDLINGILYPRIATDKVQILADGRALLIGSGGVSPSRYIQFRTEDATSVRIGMIPDNQGAMWIDTGSEKSFGIRVENGSSFGANTSSPDFFIRYGTRNISIGAGITPSAKLQVKGIDSTSANYALRIENLALINLLSVRNDGYIYGYNNVWYMDDAGNLFARKFDGQFGIFSTYVSAPYYLNTISGDTFFGDSSASNVESAVLGVYGRAVGANFILKGTTPVADQPINTSIIKGANAWASAIININGGNVEIDGGTPATGGTKGLVRIQGLTYPSVDGTAGQALKTDGAGNLTFGSANSLAIQTVSANTALTSVDYTTLVDASAGIITITLPAATNTGLVLNIKKIDASANSVVVQTAGADTIDGAANKTILAQWTSMTVQSDGTNWYII